MIAKPTTALTLLGMVVISAIGVVYAKHEGRKLFIELQSLGNERDNMEIEWGQLQLEQGTLTAQGEIEKRAREQLGMRGPEADKMELVKP